MPFLRDIEKLIRMQIPATGRASATRSAPQAPQHQGRNGGGHNHRAKGRGQSPHANGRNRDNDRHNGHNREHNRERRRPDRPAQPQPAAPVGDFANVAFMRSR
jgi:hypothetical protein